MVSAFDYFLTRVFHLNITNKTSYIYHYCYFKNCKNCFPFLLLSILLSTNYYRLYSTSFIIFNHHYLKIDYYSWFLRICIARTCRVYGNQLIYPHVIHSLAILQTPFSSYTPKIAYQTDDQFCCLPAIWYFWWAFLHSVVYFHINQCHSEQSSLCLDIGWLC